MREQASTYASERVSKAYRKRAICCGQVLVKGHLLLRSHREYNRDCLVQNCWHAVIDPLALPDERVLFKFSENRDLAKWQCFQDVDVGGQSTISLATNPETPVLPWIPARSQPVMGLKPHIVLLSDSKQFTYETACLLIRGFTHQVASHT